MTQFFRIQRYCTACDYSISLELSLLVKQKAHSTPVL